MNRTKRNILYVTLFLTIIGLLSLSLLANAKGLTLLILGTILGFSLQKSRFCFVSGFLTALFYKNTRLMKAAILAIILSNLGFSLYQYILYRNEGYLVGNISPLSLATLWGGVLFGIGMVLAGSCVLLTFVRIGEGSITFLIVFLGLIGGSLIGRSHLAWYQQYSLPSIFLPEYLGWVLAFLVQLGLLLSLYYSLHRLEEKKRARVSYYGKRTKRTGSFRDGLPSTSLKDREGARVHKERGETKG